MKQLKKVYMAKTFCLSVELMFWQHRPQEYKWVMLVVVVYRVYIWGLCEVMSY